MAVINRPPKDIRLEQTLRLMSSGKLPVDGIMVKTPNGYVAVKQVVRLSHDVYRVVT